MRQPGKESESELEIDSRNPSILSSSDHRTAFLPALHLGRSLCSSCSAQCGDDGVRVGSPVSCSASSPSGSTQRAALCLLTACSR